MVSENHEIWHSIYTEKIWKSTKFDPCNLNSYQDMDVTNLDQNPLIHSEGGHLGMSQGSIYVNNLSLGYYISKKLVAGTILRRGIQKQNLHDAQIKRKFQNFENNVFLSEILRIGT